MFNNYLPGDKTPKEKIARILRVNHAGEFGAKAIYEGQMFILNKNSKIKHMADQEQEHLDYFEEKLLEHNVRPTALSPIWKIGGFFMGMTTALIGEKAAMMCTEAVEEVIQEHYNKQLKELGTEEPELASKIRKFRDDEKEHYDEAIKSGSKNAPGYGIFSEIIKLTTKTAIKIAEKI